MTKNNIGIRSKVLEILEENPSIPYSVIGDRVGVTKERVRQIAKQNGYPPRTGILKLNTCPVCGQTFNTSNLYCSPVCGYEARRKRVIINCHQCGKPIARTPSSMRSKSRKYFCNRVCFGKWIGKNHSARTKDKKPVIGNFEYEVGPREEFPLKGRAPSPEVKEIYNALLRSNENELIKVWNGNKAKLRALGTAVKYRARQQGINITTAIIDGDGDSLLFLMRL